MNKKRILALASVIETMPHVMADRGYVVGFNMHSYTHNCGTPACIAGFAVMLAEKKSPNYKIKVADRQFSHMAGRFLGITIEQTAILFFPRHKKREEITPAEAAATLRNLAETGEVDWSIA